MDKLCAVFLDSREAVEVLDEVLACFHHTLALLVLPEEVSVFCHGIENFRECWLIISENEAPRIPKRCTTNHEAVEVFVYSSFLLFLSLRGTKQSCIRNKIASFFAMTGAILWMYHLLYSIIVAHHVTITHNRDTDMLLEIVDSCEVSFSCKCLLVCAAMD